ncbi:MAG: biotin--[acetyl-CoA-carboxylase] ligase [Nitrospinae bacterium]|nr:biotin--[acetyl-CoA-carboxylase] ligase [Nitrospinota bacterium]
MGQGSRVKGQDKIESIKIKEHLTAKFIGTEIYIFDRVESTNDTARELAKKGCKEGTVVIADLQSKGKGRLGRRWESPSGAGIYLSIILKPKKVVSQLTLVAGVAAVEAIKGIIPPHPPFEKGGKGGIFRVSLKWPNDININGKKAGGILTEGILKGKVVIVGIGINVNTPPLSHPLRPPLSPPSEGGEKGEVKRGGWGVEGFSDELKDKATSIMMEIGKRVDRNLLIAELLNSFEYWYEKFIEEGETVMKRWRELSDTVGRRIKVNAENQVFEGIAEMIDSEGSLMLRQNNGSLKRVSAGEVCY